MAKSLEEKINDLDENYAGDVRSTDPEAIKSRLLKLDIYEQELQDAKSEDMDLAQKAEAHSEAKKTYSEPLGAIKLKRSFCLQVLSEKGSL